VARDALAGCGRPLLSWPPLIWMTGPSPTMASMPLVSMTRIWLLQVCGPVS
jgi:hypothetical protein